MRQVPRRALVAAAAGSVLLTGCSGTVTGVAPPGADVGTDVTAAEFPITAAADGDPVDQAARNAITDLYSFWQDAYMQAYGDDFQEL